MGFFDALFGYTEKLQDYDFADGDPLVFNEETDTYELAVRCFSQRDNQYAPSVSCYPTSMAMVVDYILTIENKDKSDIGCGAKMQLEDYLNELISDDTTKQWMIQNTGKFGKWIWNYNRRTIAVVEEYIFNRIMREHGYKATFTTTTTYDKICSAIYDRDLPVVLMGNFKSVSSVGGHVVCCKGYNKKNLKEFIINDPFGNALTGYKDTDGETVNYGTRFFTRNNKGHMWAMFFKKI